MVIDIVDVRKQISISDFSLITKNNLNNRVSENSDCGLTKVTQKDFEQFIDSVRHEYR